MSNDLLAKAVLLSLGAGLTILCTYIIYSLVVLIISGASSGNWLMVLAGGILAYLFIGLSVFGVLAGLMIAFIGLTE